MSAEELEAAACDVHGVRLAAILPGRARASATLIVETDLGAADVAVELRRRIEPQKFPGQVVVVPHLPLSANGKVDRSALPALAARVGRAGRSSAV